MNQKSTYLSGVKTIHHQSFTILSQIYIQKHPMIIVKTSCEDIDSSMKLSVENSLSVLPLIIRAISHTFSFTNITNILKRSSKIQNQTHTLDAQNQTHTHKPAFTPKYFSNESTKAPFDNFIEQVFLHAKVFKNFISRK